jgi:hypothetical protein
MKKSAAAIDPTAVQPEPVALPAITCAMVHEQADRLQEEMFRADETRGAQRTMAAAQESLARIWGLQSWSQLSALAAEAEAAAADRLLPRGIFSKMGLSGDARAATVITVCINTGVPDTAMVKMGSSIAAVACMCAFAAARTGTMPRKLDWMPHLYGEWPAAGDLSANGLAKWVHLGILEACTRWAALDLGQLAKLKNVLAGIHGMHPDWSQPNLPMKTPPKKLVQPGEAAFDPLDPADSGDAFNHFDLRAKEIREILDGIALLENANPVMWDVKWAKYSRIGKGQGIEGWQFIAESWLNSDAAMEALHDRAQNSGGQFTARQAFETLSLGSAKFAPWVRRAYLLVDLSKSLERFIAGLEAKTQP